MRKIIITLITLLLSVGLVSAHGNSLWEHWQGQMPSFETRADMFFDISGLLYQGTAEQNTALLKSLHKRVFGSLAPLPGPSAEGTSTAGWTDDGSVVRLNTAADNVGIGTANPTVKLQVAGAGYFTGNLSMAGGSLNLSEGTATTTLTMTSTKRIGVGTTTPSVFFSIGGNLMANGTTTLSTLVIASSTIQIRGVNYILPSADGTNGQALTTDGARGLSFTSITVTSATSLAISSTTPSPLFNLTVQGGALISGTTSVSALIVSSSTLAVNGMSYRFPATRGASSTVLTEDGNGNLAFQLPGFVLLVSSSTPVATSTMLFDNLAASSTYLKIVINIPSITGGRPTLIFNGDLASNYGFRLTSENGTTYSPSAAQSYLEIQPDVNGTTTPQIFVILEGSNRAANRKVFNITGNTQLSGTQPPLPFRGGGVWNNTVTQISSISLNNSSGINNNFAAGTFVRIFGSND